MQNWVFDEFKHCGVDYANTKQAENYDQQHQKFRDYQKEFNEMVSFLELENIKDMSIVDFGCGTGATSIYAGKKFKKVYGVDVSEAMINQAKRKAEEENIKNIVFINSGFLSYKHQDEKVDVILTKMAFHHLPDFWKQIALIKMNQILKENGILYISDIIFNFDANEYEEEIDKWITIFEKNVGKEMKKEIEIHIKDEYSTFNWIIEGMLKKSGFKIEKSKTIDGFVTEYFCRKVEDI